MTDAYANLPQLADGGAVVITGGASGIGLAAARRFAGLGLPVVIADLAGERLRDAETALREAGAKVAAVPTDVSRFEDLERLRDKTQATFGRVSVLMLNAGIGLNPGGAWKNLDAWKALMEVNFWGVVHGAHAFLPAMVEARRPGFLIATGSKQGITTPPGNAAYNVSKAALKAFTESLQHELRTRKVAASAPTSWCRASPTPGLRLRGFPTSRLGPGCPNRWSSSCSRAWSAATSILSVLTTM